MVFLSLAGVTPGQSLQQAYTIRGPQENFLSHRGDWLNHAQALEKIYFNINQV
jgi:hypothetical protein